MIRRDVRKEENRTMDSNTIRIGLMLIILVWSVISAITYMARRSGNKGALRELNRKASRCGA